MIGVWRQTDQSELLGDHIHSHSVASVFGATLAHLIHFDGPAASAGGEVEDVEG